MLVNTNGVFREAKPMINKSGVYRRSTPYINHNGVWRRIGNDDKPYLDPDKLTHFRMVYKPAKWLRYPHYEFLRWNDRIFNIIKLTGPNAEFIDTYPKSLIFRFFEEDHWTSGIYALEGILYGVFDGESIPLSNMENSFNSQDINIRIDSSYLTESNGPAVMGWNRLFNSENNVPKEDGYSKNLIINSKSYMLPVYKRPSSFDIISLIGIARELRSHRQNMVGSHGALTHNINACYLNDKEMPFSLEVIIE